MAKEIETVEITKEEYNELRKIAEEYKKQQGIQYQTYNEYISSPRIRGGIPLSITDDQIDALRHYSEMTIGL